MRAQGRGRTAFRPRPVRSFLQGKQPFCVAGRDKLRLIVRKPGHLLQIRELDEGGVGVLQRLVQSNTQQLHKITISLWIARVYLSENNRREGEKLLAQIVKLAPDLYPGKVAAQLLAGLPAKSGEEPA